MDIKRVFQLGLSGAIVANVVWFFTVEQAAGYRIFYPGAEWRAIHLALSVELTEVALASILGCSRLGLRSVGVGVILGVLFCCSVYFAGLHQLHWVQHTQVAQIEFDRRRELLEKRITVANHQLLVFEQGRQKINYSKTAQELAGLTEKLEQLQRPPQSVEGLQFQIWAIFALRFAVKLAALVLAAAVGRGFAVIPQQITAEPSDSEAEKIDGAKPTISLNSTDGPVRGVDGRFQKRKK